MPALETKPAGSFSRRKFFFGALASALIVFLALYFFKDLFNPVNPHQLAVSGRLEGYQTNLSPKIGGRVDQILFREGDRVSVGELVASLSDADYQAQLRGAEARIEKAKQVLQQRIDQLQVLQAQIYGAQQHLAQAREETSAQIAQAEASLSEAEARHRQAQSELAQACSQLELSSIRLQRYTNLVKKGAVTKDEYDQALTTHTSDAATVAARQAAEKAAAQTVRAAHATLSQQRATRYTPPIRRTDVNVFQAQRAQAEHDIAAAKQDVANAVAERDQIKANIDYLQIRSPINGVVIARPIEPGAVLTPGQTVLTVLDYDKVYMRAFVPEGRIGAVKIGQGANIYLDAFPKRPFAGKVSEIDAEASFTPENIYFKDDRVKQVFGIKVTLSNPQGLAKPGMPADADVAI